jgi:hypothetical protein
MTFKALKIQQASFLSTVLLSQLLAEFNVGRQEGHGIVTTESGTSANKTSQKDRPDWHSTTITDSACALACIDLA